MFEALRIVFEGLQTFYGRSVEIMPLTRTIVLEKRHIVLEALHIVLEALQTCFTIGRLMFPVTINV